MSDHDGGGDDVPFSQVLEYFEKRGWVYQRLHRKRIALFRKAGDELYPIRILEGGKVRASDFERAKAYHEE